MARRGRRFLLHPLGDLREIAGITEVLVDAGKTNVRDMVKRLQANHHGLADASRSHLVPERLHLPLHAAYETVDPGGFNVSLAAGVPDRAGELVTVKRLALAVLLDNRKVAQLDALEGCKARSARFALAAAAD